MAPAVVSGRLHLSGRALPRPPPSRLSGSLPPATPVGPLRRCRRAGRRLVASAEQSFGIFWKSGSQRSLRRRQAHSNLYGAFPVKWSFVVVCRFFVRSGKAVLRPVACDQVRGARGRGQGTETVAKLSGLPLAALVFRSALTPEHAERR